MAKKLISLILCFSFAFQQTGFAQLACSADMSALVSKAAVSSPGTERFRPVHLRSLSYEGSGDRINALVDKGDAGGVDADSSSRDLLKYFLIGITLPDDAFWVNLRPDAPERMIDTELARTDLGKVLLEADLQLKKDAAAHTSPATHEGREYWEKLYKKAEELYGTQVGDIPALTRPWIVPDEIIVRQARNSAYVYKATLKVMLEQDYLKGAPAYAFPDGRSRELNEYASKLVRELIIPVLTKEVNSAKRYAPLRQAYYSLVLAAWFKNRFRTGTGTYSSRIDSKDLTGLVSAVPWKKEAYFNSYKRSFAEGEYRVKETVTSAYGPVMRTYFSGGIIIGLGSADRGILSTISRNGFEADAETAESAMNAGVTYITGKDGQIEAVPGSGSAFSGGALAPDGGGKKETSGNDDLSVQKRTAELVQELYGKLHDRRKAQLTAEQLVRDRFADIAYAVGLSMGLSSASVRRILDTTKVETKNSAIQAHSTEEGVVLAGDFQRPDALVDTIAAELGHRIHRLLGEEINNAMPKAVRETFDEMSQLTAASVSGALEANDVKYLAVRAFIGRTFRQFMRERKGGAARLELPDINELLKLSGLSRKDNLHKEEDEFIKYLYGQAAMAGFDEGMLTYMVYIATRDLYSSSGGNLYFLGEPVHLVADYLLFRILFPEMAQEQAEETILAYALFEINSAQMEDVRERISGAGKKMGRAVEAPDGIDFSSEEVFVAGVSAVAAPRPSFMGRAISAIASAINRLRILFAVQRIKSISAADLARIKQAASKGNETEENILQSDESSLLIRAADKSDEAKKEHQKKLARLKELTASNLNVYYFKDKPAYLSEPEIRYEYVYSKQLQLPNVQKSAADDLLEKYKQELGTQKLAFVEARMEKGESFRVIVYGPGVKGILKHWAHRLGWALRGSGPLSGLSDRLLRFAGTEITKFPEIPREEFKILELKKDGGIASIVKGIRQLSGRAVSSLEQAKDEFKRADAQCIQVLKEVADRFPELHIGSVPGFTDLYIKDLNTLGEKETARKADVQKAVADINAALDKRKQSRQRLMESPELIREAAAALAKAAKSRIGMPKTIALYQSSGHPGGGVTGTTLSLARSLAVADPGAVIDVYMQESSEGFEELLTAGLQGRIRLHVAAELAQAEANVHVTMDTGWIRGLDRGQDNVFDLGVLWEVFDTQPERSLKGDRSNDPAHPEGTFVGDYERDALSRSKDSMASEQIVDERIKWAQKVMGQKRIDNVPQGWEKAIWTWGYFQDVDLFLKEMDTLADVFSHEGNRNSLPGDEKQLVLHLMPGKWNTRQRSPQPMGRDEFMIWLASELNHRGMRVLDQDGIPLMAEAGTRRIAVTVVLYDSMPPGDLKTLQTLLKGSLQRSASGKFWVDFPAFVTGNASLSEAISSASIYLHDRYDVGPRAFDPVEQALIRKWLALEDKTGSQTWQDLTARSRDIAEYFLMGGSHLAWYARLDEWTQLARRQKEALFKSNTTDLIISLAGRKSVQRDGGELASETIADGGGQSEMFDSAAADQKVNNALELVRELRRRLQEFKISGEADDMFLVAINSCEKLEARMNRWFEPLPSEELLQTLVSERQAMGRKDKVEVSLRLQDGLTITKDRATQDILEDAICNLLMNAIKNYDAEKSIRTVVLDVTESGGTIRIAVIDNGRGIADPSNLFDGTRGADPEIVRRGGNSTGKGLPGVKQFLGYIPGADIRLEQTAVGAGSTFAITLPADATASKALTSSIKLERLRHDLANDAQMILGAAEMALTGSHKGEFNGVARAIDGIKKELQTGNGKEQRADGGDEGKGGIDFRGLPVRAQTVAQSVLTEEARRAAASLDLTKEWGAIERMTSRGLRPSCQRLSEFVAACRVQGAVESYGSPVIACIAGILRIEEERAETTDGKLRDLLISLETPA